MEMKWMKEKFRYNLKDKRKKSRRSEILDARITFSGRV